MYEDINMTESYIFLNSKTGLQHMMCHLFMKCLLKINKYVDICDKLCHKLLYYSKRFAIKLHVLSVKQTFCLKLRCLLLSIL